MKYTDNESQAGEYLRLTLSLLSKLKLVANPMNYTVMYEYASGHNAELRQVVDKCLKKSKSITDEQIIEFYNKFIESKEQVLITKLLAGMNSILKEVSSHIIDVEGDFDGHGKKLGDLAVQINEVKDHNDIKDIVDLIVCETKELVISGKQLQERMKMTSEDLKVLNQELKKSQKEAQTDLLTGLINRRGLDLRLEAELKKAFSTKLPFSVIMADIDHFKRVNDTYGHLVGDSLLKGLSNLFKTKLKRGGDVAGRFGGEEFLFLLPATKLGDAKIVANKIKLAVSTKEWNFNDSGIKLSRMTISMGVAMYKTNESLQDFIDRADKALYQAKKNGRDLVITQEQL
ncbi:MAG: GGDEF domain-containing protein [Desulfobacteraceae bacterium]|nr:GGDEF domain-containing protein [Desulfobacteraceae bacterium]